MIKGVLFDFDGTVGNTTNLILESFHYAVPLVLGKQFPDSVYKKTFGLPLVTCMERLASTPAEAEALTKNYRSFNLAHHDALIENFPGVQEALAELKEKGIKIAIVTSKMQPLCRQGLKCLDLEKYVDAVVGAGDIERAKPDADPMLKGAEALDLKPEECFCVGDSYFDLQSGHNAGCAACIAVSYTSLDINMVKELGQPDYIVDDLRKILPLIKSINK